MKKIIISLCLVFIISFTAPVKCYAEAGSLIVSGGSIAVGGLGAGALAGLSGPVVVAVFLGLMAFGFNVELTKQSEAAGKTKTQFVKDKINEYCQEIGITAGVFNSYILDQMEVLNDGRIKLSDLACKKIKQFGNWLVESNNINNPSSGTNNDSVSIGDLDVPVYSENDNVILGTRSTGENRNMLITDCIDSIGVCFVGVYDSASRYYNIAIISPVQQVVGVSITASGLNNFNCNRYVNGYYYGYFANMPLTTVNPDIPIVDNIDELLNSGDGSWDNTSSDTANDTFTGDKDDWASGNNVLDPVQDKSTVINPELTQSIPIPADKDYTVNVNDYLDAIQKVLDKLQDVSIPAVDDDTAVPDELDIPNDTVIDPTIDKVDDTDLPDPQERTPVIDKNNPPDAEKNPNLAMDPLKFDLKNIFPFCLPWDIKDMLSLLDADPVAPSYHVRWYVPIVEEYLDFTVDLSGYNDLAAMLRNMELIVFCIGLAYVTRSMFIRS